MDQCTGGAFGARTDRAPCDQEKGVTQTDTLGGPQDENVNQRAGMVGDGDVAAAGGSGLPERGLTRLRAAVAVSRATSTEPGPTYAGDDPIGSGEVGWREELRMKVVELHSGEVQPLVPQEHVPPGYRKRGLL